MSRRTRELLDLKVTHERELRLLTQQLNTTALQLQAAEYERRLEVLNGESGRIQTVLAQSVTTERYEGYITANELHWKLADKERSEVRGRDRAIYVGLGLLGPVLAVLLHFVNFT